MVLSGHQLKLEAEADEAARNVVIRPFRSAQVNPASYDLRLDSLLAPVDGTPIRLRAGERRRLLKGEVWIGRSKESIAFPGGRFFGTIHGKSGLARQGLTATNKANVVQPYHDGPVTLYIAVTEDVDVWDGMPFAQIKIMHTRDFVFDDEMADAVQRDAIRITDVHGAARFDRAHARGMSYRLHLAPRLTTVTGKPFRIPEGGLRIGKGSFFVGESVEHLSFGEPGIIASLHNDPDTAAVGLTADLCAGIIQNDHVGPVQFHIYAARDCVLYPEMEFAQVTFPRVRSLDSGGGFMLDRDAIEEAIAANRITVEVHERDALGATLDAAPADHEAIGLGNPATAHNVGIDFHLGSDLRAASIDEEGNQVFTPVTWNDDGTVVLEPGTLYLGHTLETIGSDAYAMAMHGIEPLAAVSVVPHIDADTGHPGACHEWTLEIVCAEPVTVRQGMRFGQMLFYEVRGEVLRYEGRYGSLNGAQESRYGTGELPR